MNRFCSVTLFEVVARVGCKSSPPSGGDVVTVVYLPIYLVIIKMMIKCTNCQRGIGRGDN